MAKFALAGLDMDFGKKVQGGDIIVADENFGCGSSREQAAMCLKFAGISAVVAKSFARIFYRNLINQGVPALISPEAINIIKTGDRLDIDLKSGVIENNTSGDSSTFQPLPDFIQEIITSGGIVPHLRKKLGNNK
jgi:3-isopropylmalate/(R)-2-methylmalate dehydratase small subunit